MKLSKKDMSFLETYLNGISPVGSEELGQQIWIDYVGEYCDSVVTDAYGTAVALIEGDSIDSPNVVIEAHVDEISWLVNYITDKGLIHVIRNGGSDHLIAPSKRVKIITNNGLVDGLFGWPAIHTRKGEDTIPKVENITIDVGCSTKEEVLALGIHVGCVVVYPDEFMVLNGNKFVGRSLDNKMGGFMIAMVAKHLKENGVRIPYNLYIVNSVQEEIGLRGAQMISHSIKPDLVIVTDVCHDSSTPMISVEKQGDIKIGCGPVIGYAPAIHKGLRDYITRVAASEDIKFQRLAMSTSTGTDTDAFAYSNGGIPSALISLPLRYMHTTVEMAQQEDVEALINLIYHSLINLDLNSIRNGNSIR
jgi:putative aminopeptidase FrvX